MLALGVLDLGVGFGELLRLGFAGFRVSRVRYWGFSEFGFVSGYFTVAW